MELHILILGELHKFILMFKCSLSYPCFSVYLFIYFTEDIYGETGFPRLPMGHLQDLNILVYCELILQKVHF